LGHPGIGGGGSQKWWKTAGKLWKNASFPGKTMEKWWFYQATMVILGDFIGGISPRKMMF